MDNLRLGIEWDVNEAQLNASMAGARKQITSTSQTVEEMEDSVNQSLILFKEQNETLKNQSSIVETLKSKISGLQLAIIGASDITAISKLNKELQVYENELTKVNRAGRQGFDDQGRAMISNEGILQRLARAAALYERGMIEATRPENIEKYSQKLALVNSQISQMTKGVSVNGNFNGLQNSINQISRELPAFTYSIQTGFMAISNNLPIFADELVRIRKENEALNASGKKGVPVWKQLAQGLFSWGTLMSVGITLLTVYGKEIGSWISKLIGGKNALDNLKASQESLNKAFSDSSFVKAMQDVNRLRTAVDMAKDGFVDKKAVVEEYNKTIGQTTGEIKSLDEAERFLIDNANNYVKMMLYKAAANKSLEEAALSAIEAEKIRIKDLKDFEKTADRQSNKGHFSTGGGAYVSQTDIKNANDFAIKEAARRKGEEVKIHEDAEKKQLTISENFMKKAQSFAGKMNISVFGDDPKKVKDTSAKMESLFDKIAKGRADMQNKILDLDKEYARKSMESDEAELQALKDKFAKFRRIIEAENTEIAKYNNKNKGKKGFKPVTLLDVGEVDPIEKRATEDVVYKQDTAKLAKEIEEQKKLFTEYEEYKNKLGQDKANDTFKDRLNGFKTYVEYLKSVADKEAEAMQAVDKKTASAGQEQRAKLIEKESKEALSAEQKKQTDLLALIITYDQKRKELIRKFEEERAGLIAGSSAEELSAFDRKHIEELNQLDDANIQKLTSYKALFDGIDKLTDAGARKVIKDAEGMLASGINVSPEMLKKIRETLKDATKSLDERLPDRVMKLSGAFGEMASSIGQVNEELGSMLQGVSNVLKATVQISGGFKDLTKGINNYQQNKTDGGGGLLGGISAIAGIAGPAGQIVSAVAGVASGVVKFFGAAKESARLAEKQLKEYQDKIIEGELEYGRLLRERARSQGAVNEMTLKELEIQRELLETQLKSAKLRDLSYNKNINIGKFTFTTAEKVKREEVLTDYEYALEKILQDGTEVTGQRKEKYGGFLGIGKKTRLVDVTDSLAGKTYEDLEKLYTEGKMNDATKALFENLQKAKNEVDDINELMKEIDETIMDKMSGGVSASSISSTIIQGFKDGKRGAIDFADDIHDIIQNALLSAMSATVLEEPLRELVKKFREDSKDGLTQEEIDAFKTGYESVVQKGLDAMKEIDKITGGKIGSDSGSLSSGRINRTVSEDTASGILGFERSRYDLAKQQLLAVQSALDFEKKSYEEIVESVRYLKAIEQNTKDTVFELKNVVSELKKVNNNTSQQSNRAYTG